mgnify:CR=1 FL=1
MTFVLTYITWDVSPFIYEGEHFAISWYGTLWTLGLIGMLITLLATFKHDGVPTQYALITFMVSLVCVIFFGHLFQGLFYEWDYLPDNPAHVFGTDWHYRNYYFEHPWKFFDFAHGGFASHGCVLGVLVAGWICAKILRCDMWFAADRAMMGLFWVAVAVRIGNLINNEICGIETSLPWGFCFGEETVPRHPSQIYEILSYLLAMGVAWWLFLKRDGGQYKGMLSAVIMTIVLLLRILIEFVKLPQMEIEQDWALLMGQWLSIPFAIYAIWLLFHSLEQGKQADIALFAKLTRTEKRRLKKK